MSIDPNAQNGGAPEYGEAVELALCDLLDLEHVDGAHVDARSDDGERYQIKGTQRWVSNGGTDDRARGRITVWSEALLHLLQCGDRDRHGRYIVAIYDPDEWAPDPDAIDYEAFIVAWAYVEPEHIGDLAREKWHDAHRPSKGKRAAIRWADVSPLATALEYAEADTDTEADADAEVSA